MARSAAAATPKFCWDSGLGFWESIEIPMQLPPLAAAGDQPLRVEMRLRVHA